MAFRSGFSFGLASGTITSLGLMVGLHSGTHQRLAVIGGIITVAVADAFADALGIHLAEESRKETSQREVWLATITTLVSKFVFGLSFVIPLLLLDLLPAVIVSVVWGLLVLTVFSFLVAKRRRVDPGKAILEHLGIAMAVILLAHFIGDWTAQTFGSM
jgi:VIT1/CCC1 family predicted Fe2+/Mn2+ transporter